MPHYIGQGGPVDRPKRYDRIVSVKLSDDDVEALKEIADARDTKPATIMRRAIRKEIWIHKRQQEKLQAKGDDNDETTD